MSSNGNGPVCIHNIHTYIHTYIHECMHNGTVCYMYMHTCTSTCTLHVHMFAYIIY